MNKNISIKIANVLLRIEMITHQLNKSPKDEFFGLLFSLLVNRFSLHTNNR